MKAYSPLFLLAALGVLSAAGTAAAQTDTSQWKCESCPYPKGSTGSVNVGVVYASDDSPIFGNYTGLNQKGAYLDLGGTVTGPKGPEAGVWVIAETGDLPTKFVKIVVKDDRGR